MSNEAKYFPSISVIVPIYNGETDLPQLIECILKQTYPKQLSEYLLVDNNSSDRTPIILKEVQQTVSETGINLRHLTEKEIQSSYAARNLGIRQAKGEILVFTDADCRPQPNWLEQIVQPFNNSQIGIIVGEVVALCGNTLLEKYADRNQVMSQKFLLQHPFYPYGQTANIAIRKEAFVKVGLFRPHLTTGGDADICWRIQKETSWQLAYAPTAIIEHRHRSNLKNFRSQFRRYGSSNRYLHELHGVDLMRELTPQEVFYRISRWLLKELPTDSLKAIARKTPWIDLIKTPIDLIGFQARTQGQQESKLPEAARKIEWL
ncbi:glycosyl transferase family 2 [Stanieria cyanosphaera PCC 7437]|uniref:Glycosyl transferase family 2 n=1 Tax=Stanieria cyanosphaera (strain ATCC 29371 / PCC 7437) TaxID=111780 RepID=K9XPL5_STAC7|nr:glycosyltransferase [Stanieria cyanosphaera]AFZ34044.1 glycosyl transferase family 2 [Stanieria cyanosphaera PCC 7437]